MIVHNMNRSGYKRKTKAELIAEIEALQEHAADMEMRRADCAQMAESLFVSREMYRILLDQSSDPIFTFYPDGTYRYVNYAFAEGVGRTQEEIIGRKIWDVFPKDEADKRFAAVKWVFENAQVRVIEVRVPRPDGDRYYITTVKPVLGKGGKVLSVLCISKDITDRKRMEEELRHLSTYDLLSGLYNRNFFETEVARIQESRLFPVSVVMIDLNHLKTVNDQYGHAAGDDLIRKAAMVIKESFRAEEIIARFGGDEFVVLLPETGEKAAGEAVARLRSNVARQNDPLLSLAVGWASGDKGCSLLELMRLADDRMYQEKAAGKASAKE